MKMEISNELVGVIITEHNQNFKSSDAAEYFQSANINVAAEVVENSGSEVNLCLPYYSWIPDGKPQEIRDDNMTEASGGVEYGIIREGGLLRLRPTSNSDEWNRRNMAQLGYNMMVSFTHRRADLADNTYDGDFDRHSYATAEDVAQHVSDNPK